MNILGGILEGVIEGALSGALKGTGLDPGPIARTVTTKVSTNPVVVNETNSEAPYQSRVVVYTTIGMIGAMFVAGDHLWTMWQTGEINVAVAIAEVTTLLGMAGTLYGRLKSGLKPLFSR